MRALTACALLLVCACSQDEPTPKNPSNQPDDMGASDASNNAETDESSTDGGLRDTSQGDGGTDAAGVDLGPLDQPTGSACGAPEQCDGGLCLSELLYVGQAWNLPDGYCSRPCQFFEDCENDTEQCFQQIGEDGRAADGVCLQSCTSDDECRADYRCDQVQRCVPRTPIGAENGAWSRSWSDVTEALGAGVDAGGNVYFLLWLDFGGDIGGGVNADGSGLHVASFDGAGVYRWESRLSENLRRMEVGPRIALTDKATAGIREIPLQDMSLGGEPGWSAGLLTGFSSSAGYGMDFGPGGELAVATVIYDSIDIGGTVVDVATQSGAAAVVMEADGTPRWGAAFDASQGADVAVTSDGDVWFVGTGESFDVGGTVLGTEGGNDAFAIELSGADGTPQTALSWGSAGADLVRRVVIDPDGNLYLLGNFTGPMTIGSDMLTGGAGLAAFLAKLDASGNVLWAREYPGTFDNLFLAVAPDGGVRIAGSYTGMFTVGSTEYTSANGYDVFILDVDEDGNPAGFQSHTSTGVDDFLHGYAIDPAGADIIAGEKDGSMDFGSGRLVVGDAFFARLPRE